jgi:hypothetical protein
VFIGVHRWLERPPSFFFAPLREILFFQFPASIRGQSFFIAMDTSALSPGGIPGLTSPRTGRYAKPHTTFAAQKIGGLP